MNQNQALKGDKMLRVWWWFTHEHMCTLSKPTSIFSSVHTRSIFRIRRLARWQTASDQTTDPTINRRASLPSELPHDDWWQTYAWTWALLFFTLHANYMQHLAWAGFSFLNPWTKEHAAMKVTANILADQSCMFSFQRVPSSQHISSHFIMAGEDTLLSPRGHLCLQKTEMVWKISISSVRECLLNTPNCKNVDGSQKYNQFIFKCNTLTLQASDSSTYLIWTHKLVIDFTLKLWQRPITTVCTSPQRTLHKNQFGSCIDSKSPPALRCVLNIVRVCVCVWLEHHYT